MAPSRDARAPQDQSGEPDDASVTDLGEPALVRATSIDIGRGVVLAGRYQIEATLGKGGSGIVLRAFDRVAQVPVAVKILKPELASDPRWIERFSRELRLARQMQHANVCRVFDIGQADGHWFITMELASGGTLRDQLGPRASERSSEERLSDIRAVVAGLAAIHEAGIVHRDVKPDNFLRMADGRLVLSDFGLATNPTDAPTVSIMVGTPHYMAPEVAMGDPATQCADIWSAAVVIHEILIGQRPERLSLTRFKMPESTPNLSRAERRVLAWSTACLDQEPEQRPENGAAAQRAVEAAIAAPLGPSSAWRKHSMWGAVALGTLGLGIGFRHHLGRSAQATSATASAPPRMAEIQSSGTPLDWSADNEVFARFDGQVHCFSLLPGKTQARAVWGTPRRAETLDLATGKRWAADLAPESYQSGCPQTSPSGDRLLVTRVPNTGSPQILLAAADGSNGQVLTNGTEPLWLPNGEEFLFDVDATHVGVFSLPTMAYTLLPDSHSDARTRHVDQKAISPGGDSFAILYTETRGADLERTVDVLAFPNLAVAASYKVPYGVRRLQYRKNELLLSSSTKSSGLEALDWRTGQSRRVGYVPDQMVESVLDISGEESLLVSAMEKIDAWFVAAGNPDRQVTRDGRSVWASASKNGDVLVSRKLDHDGFVIFRYDARGNERQVTSGPFDMVPSFAPDGASWVYADYQRKAIMRCDGRSCAEVRRDDVLMGWPAMSPDGRRIAFVSLEGTPHVHVMDVAGSTDRDLGSTALECPPVWTGDDALWAYGGSGDRREWREIDLVTGLKTGRVKRSSNSDFDSQTCETEGEREGSAFYRQARLISQERWEVRKARSLRGLVTGDQR
jgi:serine/threonine-protein kinase